MPLDAATFEAIEVRTEPADARAAVDALFDAAFGPGRFAKTAERVRERTPEAPALCVTAFEGGRVVGAARQHLVRIDRRAGTFLGPFAVASDRRGLKIGPRMLAAAGEAARQAELGFVLLVGARSYFEPLGFRPVARGEIDLGGPVDPDRLLIRLLADGPEPAGRVTAA